MSDIAPRPTSVGLRVWHWWVLALVLAGCAIVLILLALSGGSPTSKEPPPASEAAVVSETPKAPSPAPSPAPEAAMVSETPNAPSPAPEAMAVSETPSAAAAAARPDHLDIPAIGVSTSLIRLGLNKDRTVQVPSDADRAGWFDLGTVPGQNGSSVILGHVDSTEGPAVFFRLGNLVPGALLDVRLSDGAVAQFRVTRVATYANEDFPAKQVYAGSPDRPTLNLVTCGGAYDAAKGGYQSNVVVFSEHLQTTPAD